VFEDSTSHSPLPNIPAARCEHCGKLARVYILEGYADGKPLRRCLCLNCADTEDERWLDGDTGLIGGRRSSASLLTAVGLLLLAFGAFVDELGIHTSIGFGLKQQTSLLIGALVVILGGLLRIDVLTVAGVILFGLAALADVFREIGSPGVGWQQGMAIVAGVAFLLAGLLLRRRRTPRRLSLES
jgi:hypothetical protein